MQCSICFGSVVSSILCSFINYVDKFFGVFLPPIPLRWQFLLYKSWHFGATYPPFLAKVVCERPLRLSRKQTALFFPHSLNHVFVFATLHLFLGYTVSQKENHTIAKSTVVYILVEIFQDSEGNIACVEITE